MRWDRDLASRLLFGINDKSQEVIKGYCEQRIEDLHKSLEQTTSWEDTLRFQGEIKALREIMNLRKYASQVMEVSR